MPGAPRLLDLLLPVTVWSRLPTLLSCVSFRRFDTLVRQLNSRLTGHSACLTAPEYPYVGYPEGSKGGLNAPHTG